MPIRSAKRKTLGTVVEHDVALPIKGGIAALALAAADGVGLTDSVVVEVIRHSPFEQFWNHVTTMPTGELLTWVGVIQSQVIVALQDPRTYFFAMMICLPMLSLLIIRLRIKARG